MTPCSMCGHVGCGHTDAERQLQERLEAQVIKVPSIAVDATTMAIVGDSYSGDILDPEHDGGIGRIRRPFCYANELWISTGGGPGHSADCYRVVPRNQFKEKTRRMSDYYKCTEEEQDSLWRYAPKGFYHGIVATNGKQEYVLVGPETQFVLTQETTAKKK